MKYSKQKEIILDGLINNAVHPTAECLYTILKPENPNLSLATVYRNLNKLADNKIIKKISGLDTSEHYDHNTSDHYHMICENCKKIYDIPSNIAADLKLEVEKITNHKINNYDIVFKGICEDCRKDI